MHLRRLSEVLTDGEWDVSSLVGPVCCLQGSTNSGIVLILTIFKPLFTLRKWLLGEPKGVRRLKGATVYIVRLNSAGNTRMAKPCEKCQRLLRRWGVRYVVYTTDDGWRAEVI